METTIRLAKPSDAVEVGQRLWVRGKEEFVLLGETEHPSQILTRLLVKSSASEALLVNGELMILSGLVDDLGERCTWFQAVNGTEVLLGKLTPILKDWFWKHQGRIVTYSVCHTPKTVKWFKALGLQMDYRWTSTLPNGVKLYKFVRG